jgi:hypothetical protein
MLWDLNESKHLYSLTAGDEIHALVFSEPVLAVCSDFEQHHHLRSGEEEQGR